MRRAGCLIVAALLLSGCSPERFEATGFYRVARTDARWWLVDPLGKPFYSIGVNDADSGGYDDPTGHCPYCETIASQYPSIEAWRQAVATRLRSWGFNTVGAWSDDGFPDGLAYTPILDIGNGISDFFASELEQQAASIAAEKVRPKKDDPDLLGYFLGNEMHWGPDWRSSHPLLDDYLMLPEGSPGRAAAEAHAGDPNGFLAQLAARYFQVATQAVRAEDPNHLLLGVRGSSLATPPEVVQAAGPWLDVFSVNSYDLPEEWQYLFVVFRTTEVDDWLRQYHELSGLPLLISEFTYRSREADVPSEYPPIYYTFDTQAERAAAFRTYAERCYQAPYVVGHHWFEYYDEPPGGRFDGEDSNFGLVSNGDVPYGPLVETMAEVHARAPHLVR